MGKELDVPAEEAIAKFDRMLRELLLLNVEESHAQARRKAFPALQSWLQGGAESPDVALRAVQTMLANPEVAGTGNRPAITKVSAAVAELWTKAGVDEAGMLGLQVGLLAGWPPQPTGWLALAHLFESVWPAVKHPTKLKHLVEPWWENVLITNNTTKPEHGLKPPQVSTVEKPPYPSGKATVRGNGYTEHLDPLFVAIREDITGIIGSLGTAADTNSVNAAFSQIVEMIAPLIQNAQDAQRDFLWWGSARYSHSTRRPYRRIEDASERLWWMATDASELAKDLDSTSAASFLVETIRQVDGDTETKRPLKEWMRELAATLHQLNQSDQYNELGAMRFSTTLKTLAQEDPLGLPVTWIRLQAREPERPGADFEERAREATGLDLDTKIDRGDWAAWIFRESILDSRLASHKT